MSATQTTFPIPALLKLRREAKAKLDEAQRFHSWVENQLANALVNAAVNAGAKRADFQVSRPSPMPPVAPQYAGTFAPLDITLARGRIEGQRV